ncbi:GreA/GreB family elongation factor [Reinekea marina]|uniref:GreA/GreB family elongation factor n=1 Tax=Reinekea marina TaxID=1310421 RepID=A0ABV7WU13_9GAMM|nr:GreA/GreB family elongation factor [Reinekea marina]MDN3650888.1 GreA/GreB family elongation factor [Reinekea marina]
MNNPEITISSYDFDLISDLLDKMKSTEELEKLSAELDRANVVALKDLPGNIVAINSTVSFIIETTQKAFTYKLVTPKPKLEDGGLSIMSPIGSAIIGLSEGQTIEWPMSKGETVTVKITNVNHAERAQKLA